MRVLTLLKSTVLGASVVNSKGEVRVHKSTDPSQKVNFQIIVESGLNLLHK